MSIAALSLRRWRRGSGILFYFTVAAAYFSLLSRRRLISNRDGHISGHVLKEGDSLVFI
jgi:hypothetical protein